MNNQRPNTVLDSVNKKIYKSISKEFNALKDRLEIIIGTGTHNLENGNYRERILMDYLEKNLPSSVRVCTGFITNIVFDELSFETSTQQDILILKPNSQVLFDYGRVVVAPKESVLATIEVKTSIKNWTKIDSKHSESLSTILNKLNGSFSERDDIFKGVFVYKLGGSESYVQKNIVNNSQKKDQLLKILNSSSKNTYVTLGDSLFYRNTLEDKNFYYFKEDFSFGYFISNLKIYVEKHISEEKYLANYILPSNGKDNRIDSYKL